MAKKVNLKKTPEQICIKQTILEAKHANAAKPVKVNMSFKEALHKIAHHKI